MESKLRIIGISGTNGSGKDTVGDLLAKYFGYKFTSVTDALRTECVRRGWSTDREFTRTVSAEWRREFGMAVLVDRAMESFKNSSASYVGVAMASLRNPLEAERIHQLGGTMIWVDADPRIRYQRIRTSTRIRGDEDNKTYEQFLKDDDAEMHPPQGADQAELNMAAVKEKSDIILVNDSTPEALKAQIEAILQKR